MNLCNAQAASLRGDSGGGGTLGSAFQAAPAHPITVGAVGFGPCLEDEEIRLTDKGWKTITDSMAASIIRLEQENDELRAEVALLREEQRILQNTIEGLRDQLCADKCRDKAAADGGWSNI